MPKDPRSAASGRLTIEELQAQIESGQIDTVIAATVDLQGRLMGKRVSGRYFMDSVAKQGVHACSYLWAMDVENNLLPGFALTSWRTGYQDMLAVLDFSTIRRVPWLEATAVILCDLLTEHGETVEVYPRQILRRQLEKASALGYRVKTASELEFFVFRESYEEAAEKSYHDLTPWGHYIEDYHILQGTKLEWLLRQIRNGMEQADIPVEYSKGEWGHGQSEINLRYAEALEMADRHVLYKNGAKEIAALNNVSLTFMAKWSEAQAGSSFHLHSSLWSSDDSPLFYSHGAEPFGMSDLMKYWVAGQLAMARDFSLFYAPNINSYKRYREGSFAPVKVVWGYDNRTCGLRLVGEGPSLRMESRIPGADANPYLGFAATVAAGLYGIEHRLDLAPMFSGDAYLTADVPSVPADISEAIGAMEHSATARELLGDEVIDHYLQLARCEVDSFNSVVTCWERSRNFERI